MGYPTLPQRVFKSPLIRFVNFKNNRFINLIRLIKPYANGDSYAVYETTKNPFCSNGLFKTLEDAQAKFELMVSNEMKENEIISQGYTGN